MKQFVFLALSISSFYFLQAQKIVRVAVWEKFDRGMLPVEKIYVNPKEKINGLDDDANGFIDDIHGIGFDENEELIYESFKPEYNQRKFYDHGTAVADIILKRAPNTQLYGIGFIPFGTRLEDDELKSKLKDRLLGDIEHEKKIIRGFVEKSIAYLAKNKIQVVNLSWGANRKYFDWLFTQLGLDPSQHAARIDDWMKSFNDVFFKQIKKNPNIIFVVGAGNYAVDVHEVMDVPANMDLPNVIVVGAINSKGEVSTFSNRGKNIRVYALGEGHLIKKSYGFTQIADGTSFAAPIITAYIANGLSAGKSFPKIKQELIKQKYFY